MGGGVCMSVCVELQRVKKAGAVPDPPTHLSLYNLYICYVFGVSGLCFTYELYIKINALKIMNIYCSEYTGLQLLFPSMYFQLTCFIVPLTCKL